VIHVFIGGRQSKVSYELAEALQRMGPKSSYIKISGHGKNALDFHIAYYLGKLHQADSSAYFHILSKDKGFDPLVEHLRERKVLVSRIESVLEIPIVRAMKANTRGERLEIVLARLKQLKAAKPRRIRTLENTIFSLFHKRLSEAEVAEIVTQLQREGYVEASENRISYKLPSDA
jgi:hypothetical protein